MTGPLRVLIADDEPDARAKLRRLLGRHADVSVVGEATTGVDVIRAVRTLEPHVVLLDIRMPEMDGIRAADVISATVDVAPKLIFVTAYDAHAIRAFEVQALDYVLKPYDAPRLSRALDRIRQQLALERVSDSDAARLTVENHGRRRAVYLREIEWIESYGNYVRLYTARGRILKRGTIKALEARLDATRFTRIHRCAIVNLDHVRTLTPAGSGDQWLRVQSGARLRLSRANRVTFLARWHARLDAK